MTEASNDKIPKAELRLAEKIAAEELANAQFRQMTPEEKRVAIAKDVLAWLAEGKLKPLAQYYVVVPPEVEDVVNGFKCQACALGAIFACAVEHGEAGGTVRRSIRNEYDRKLGMNIADTPSGWSLYSKLADLFDEKQLALIETAFEGLKNLPYDSRELVSEVAFDENYDRVWTDPPEVKKADRFHHRYRTARQRMTKIMQNIIRNNGTFKP